MTIHQTLSEAEYQSATEYLLKQQFRHTLCDPKWLVGLTVIVIAGLYWLWVDINDGLTFAVTLGILAVMMPIGFPFILKHLARQAARKTYRDPANATMFQPRDYVLTDTDVMATSALGTSSSKWSAFTDAIELPSVFVIQETNLSAVILSKAAMSPAQLTDVRQQLHQHFPDAKLEEGTNNN